MRIESRIEESEDGNGFEDEDDDEEDEAVEDWKRPNQPVFLWMDSLVNAVSVAVAFAGC